MGIATLVLGKSGSGKSTSLRNFKKDEVALINVLDKPMPFDHGFDSTLPNGQCKTLDYATIMKAISSTSKKVIVIDDAGYLITKQFMNGHSTTGAGNAIFSFYNDIADGFWSLVQFITNNDRVAKDKTVYLMMHEDLNDAGDVKPKTIGKLLDEKVCVEGMFSMVLRAMCEDGRYVFKTKTDGHDVTKTPIGMFDGEEIDNDLKAVDERIREFYHLNKTKSDNKEK